MTPIMTLLSKSYEYLDEPYSGCKFTAVFLTSQRSHGKAPYHNGSAIYRSLRWRRTALIIQFTWQLSRFQTTYILYYSITYTVCLSCWRQLGRSPSQRPRKQLLVVETTRTQLQHLSVMTTMMMLQHRRTLIKRMAGSFLMSYSHHPYMGSWAMQALSYFISLIFLPYNHTYTTTTNFNQLPKPFFLPPAPPDS